MNDSPHHTRLPAALYVVATPIGNLGDITLRVLETLKAADLIAAEDTRRTRQLLTHFGISKPLVSFFEHNELKRLPDLLERLHRGEKIALVSDAGMPAICDPGYRLVRAALDAGLPVEVLPGPSAIETALVASGFTTDSFMFAGYLPRRKGDLQKALARIAAEPATCVAFESPHRLRATLAAAAGTLGERPVAICRELTKRFEDISRGSASELAANLPEKVKGEIVLVFAGAAGAAAAAAPAVPEAATPEAAALEDAVRTMLAGGLSARKTAAVAAVLTGLSRNRAYQLVLRIKRKMEPA